ncbi:glycosyl hydrolase 115 family protein [Butyrivibrio sp. VCB2006]|uniref:glycosyl hydrolase 115 family protein n=1 Tax=Butyrivibrio sp. VCB2006 TaxID=1280679 RepID=UPI0003F634C8|nr:glycosyl hydrolase 115 family protein [Butyrivibrio sp. VCB2006]
MSKFLLYDGNRMADILIENEAYQGAKEIGKTVAEDICLVTDRKPSVSDNFENASSENVIFVATVGKSGLLSKLSKAGRVDLSVIDGKREVFFMKVVDISFDKETGEIQACGKDAANSRKILVIAGSDKRGTIYGMFHLSELCGVSPLVYFGDAMPEKRNALEIEIGADSDAYISKEPSVYYRGFFINDEWPAFGNWAYEKFGGVNAKCYRKVFELLLRLKGNYMWPAMWNSNFSEDGPGIENARLADELGVIMGTSHHEPLFRAGNEWQQQYKEYGDDNSWSFLSNEKAITKFWENGVLRNKDFESVITIGMRGEADSKLLPEDATMKDNIEVVKKAILAQDEILREHISEDYKAVPRMLAIYKEVEDYYYGDETCEGLKDWDELKDAIFLLSDDNHGNLRNLPTEAEKQHPGGYGMYYHFDYHGAPISYEWTNCNRLTKTWEQMTTAYEAGVTKMWIVNVGDLKEMEYPLSFFMELAYDYETWGLNGLNKVKEYVYKWIDQQFGSRISSAQKDDLFKVLEGYTRLNAMRTPETMNERIYHPVHLGEGERILTEARDILATADKLKEELSGEALLTYESIVYYAAAASLNLVIAWILTGMNHGLARKGSLYANTFIDEIEERIALDKKLVDEFHHIADGKWNHCLSSAHTGFRSWDDREWAYPAVVKVAPLSVAKAMVSFRGQDRYHLGAHWQDMAPLVCDSLDAFLDIDTRGEVGFEYKITLESGLVCCDKTSGRVEICPDKISNPDMNSVEKYNSCRETVSFTCNEKSLSELTDSAEVKGRVDISFDNGQKTYVDLLFKLGARKPFYCISAADYSESHKIDGKGFEVIDFLGKEGTAIKAFPPMKAWDDIKVSDMNSVPYVSYDASVNEEGECDIIFFLMTRNPYAKGGRLKFYVSVGDEKPQTVYSVSDHYYTEWQDEDWAQGVLTAGRQVTTSVKLQAGSNTIRVYAGDPGVIIEKLVIKRRGYEIPTSYLGPNA